MVHNHNIVSAVEFGTSKITLLTGECTNSAAPRIIGYCTIPHNGVVVKGEIQDMEKAEELLERAVKTVSDDSGIDPAEGKILTVLVNGCQTASRQGIGTAKARSGIITDDEIFAASEEAKVLNLAADREIINSATTSFLVDSRQVLNPRGQSGTELEIRAHIVHAVSSRIDNFRKVICRCFDTAECDVLFSPLASDIGILSDKERDSGVLLVDIGAGCTDYVVEFKNGIWSSGSLQLGFEHVANDLSIAFSLPVNTCRQLLANGKLNAEIENNSEEIECINNSGKKIRIPMQDILTVVDARLEEIFTVIKHNLIADKVPKNLESGGVLTGGGAKFIRTKEAFSKIFELSCSVRFPADADGAVTEVKDPAFSAVWGALKFSAEKFMQTCGDPGSRNRDNWHNRWKSVVSNFKDFWASFKF